MQLPGLLLWNDFETIQPIIVLVGWERKPIHVPIHMQFTPRVLHILRVIAYKKLYFSYKSLILSIKNPTVKLKNVNSSNKLLKFHYQVKKYCRYTQMFKKKMSLL